MSRRSIVETSEGGRTEIDYSSLSGIEIDSRIHAHEARYGSTLRDYSLSFSCDAASPHVTTMMAVTKTGRESQIFSIRARFSSS